MGKEEIARYEQFLLFPQCFQKLSVIDALKLASMELRVKHQVTVHVLQNESKLDQRG